MSLILYHYWRSSSSWRVRWALELKAVPHELRAVDLLKSEEQEAEYRKLNPSQYVPCIVEGEFHLGESLAIIEWLEEKYPQVPLLGTSIKQRAKIRQMAEIINSGIQPLQNLVVLKKYSPDKDAQEEWIRHWISRGLSVVENLLAEAPRSGLKFSLSAEPSMADLCLIPQCYNALRYQVDLAAYPQCKAIYEYALTTEACQRSAPDAYKPN